VDDRHLDSTRNEVIEETLYWLKQADRQLFAVIQTEIPLSGDLLEAYTFLQESIAALTRTLPATSGRRPRTNGSNSFPSGRGARFL
jgi:hypothetical protein